MRWIRARCRHWDHGECSARKGASREVDASGQRWSATIVRQPNIAVGALRDTRLACGVGRSRSHVDVCGRDSTAGDNTLRDGGVPSNVLTRHVHISEPPGELCTLRFRCRAYQDYRPRIVQKPPDAGQSIVAGKRIVTRVPVFALLSSEIVPSIRSTARFAIARPSPEPSTSGRVAPR